MKRRTVLMLPALGLCATALPVAAMKPALNYTPDVYQQALDSGEPFLLDFYAAW